MQKIPDSLVRILILMAATVTAVVILRFVVLPSSWTDMDQHKARAVKAELAKEIKYAGAQACQDCHDAEPEALAEGRHATLSCETCHGAAQAHIDDPEVKPTAPRQRDFCPVCHAYDPSRPTGFPQINPIAHNPMEPCIKCHNPHAPRPPVIPDDCGACHAEIQRTKAVSRHARLECTTCHNAPKEHRDMPRLTRPSKPTQRSFCAQCHGLDSTNPETVKIDLASHGGRYLCWQCHYPHMPEGK